MLLFFSYCLCPGPRCVEIKTNLRNLEKNDDFIWLDTNMVKKAKITVYCCGLFLDSILSKRAGFSICRSNFSQGPYSNIIHTLIWLNFCYLEPGPSSFHDVWKGWNLFQYQTLLSVYASSIKDTILQTCCETFLQRTCLSDIWKKEFLTF